MSQYVRDAAELAERAGVGSTARHLYTLLAAHRNRQTDTAWPTIKLLAKRIGKTEATIRRAMRELEDVGLAERCEMSNGYYPNEYRLALTAGTLGVIPNPRVDARVPPSTTRASATHNPRVDARRPARGRAAI